MTDASMIKLLGQRMQLPQGLCSRILNDLIGCVRTSNILDESVHFWPHALHAIQAEVSAGNHVKLKQLTNSYLASRVASAVPSQLCGCLLVRTYIEAFAPRSLIDEVAW